MAVTWNRHRFSGGVLILDTTNTVVLRGDASRSFDRFDDPEEIARFASAATGFRKHELGGRALVFEQGSEAVGTVLEMREKADTLFRRAVGSGGIDTAQLAGLLGCAARCLDGDGETIGRSGEPFGNSGKPLRFQAALALSALSLLSEEKWRRIRVCQNCNWLFIDKSRNASRLWCDMSVCGNRQKARRHYARRKAKEVADA